jgi:hypothetical protein
MARQQADASTLVVVPFPQTKLGANTEIARDAAMSRTKLRMAVIRLNL